MKPWREIAHLAQDHPTLGSADPGSGGYFVYQDRFGTVFHIIASWAMEWDHVSVSLPNRCPTWSEMDEVRKVFFRPNETVVQYHVPETQHINNHPYTLHLWRPQRKRLPTPPEVMV